MAFREKRSDTLVRSVERTYGVDFGVRNDMELGTLLRRRGFESQSQILKAYKGELGFHPAKRRVFISFHSDDFSKSQGLRLMFLNQNLELDLEDVSRKAIRSDNECYVRAALKCRIQKADVLLCVVGNGTGSREWVEWEIQTALSLGVPVCGLRIPNTFGKFPNFFKNKNYLLSAWSPEGITAVIESAIARGV